MQTRTRSPAKLPAASKLSERTDSDLDPMVEKNANPAVARKSPNSINAHKKTIDAKSKPTSSTSAMAIEYEFRVQTGNESRLDGTSQSVSLEIFDSKGQSLKVPLVHSMNNSQPFQKGQLDIFHFTIAHNLQAVRMIIRHAVHSCLACLDREVEDLTYARPTRSVAYSTLRTARPSNHERIPLSNQHMVSILSLHPSRVLNGLCIALGSTKQMRTASSYSSIAIGILSFELIHSSINNAERTLRRLP